MITLLRQLIFEDFKLKLFSLGLAVLVWFTISFAVKNDIAPLPALPMTTDTRTFYSLPVLVVSSAADVRSFKVSPQEVAVTVQGDARSLQALKSQDIRALVDLTGIEAVGDVRKRIEISTPAGITHVRVAPQEVRVLFPARR